MRLPVTLELRPSAVLMAALLFIHTLAAVVVSITELHIAIRVALWSALTISAWRSIWFNALRNGPDTIIALTLCDRVRIEIEHRNGGRFEARLDGRSTVFSGLVVLLLQCDGRTSALTLPLDAMGPTAHRQLRLWLRWRSTAASGA